MPFDYFERAIICITPIIVAWFSWRSAVTQKKTKELVELQAKYNAKEKEIQKNEKDEQKQNIAKLSEDMCKVKEQIDQLSQTLNLEELHKQLSKISAISKINYDYSQSLSQVICAIGKCIEVTDPEGKSAQEVASVLAAHQQKEMAINKDLYNIAL